MNIKYDKIEKNMPIKYEELNKLWVYEGNNEVEFTPFTGKYLNRAGKAIFINFIYLQKIVQINKSILSIFEGNYEIYNPTKIYNEGDSVYYNGSFYISIDDNNNKSLSDDKIWYKFTPRLNNLPIVDEKTGDLYTLGVYDGKLELTKVEDD